MSIFQFQSTGAEPFAKRITANTATTLVDASLQKIIVPWFQVNEINGGTQNLTVDLYDVTNTTAYYLGSDGGFTWNAKAVTAKASYLFSQGLFLPKGWLLRVTSSDVSGYFHCHGIFQRLG